MDLWYFYLQFTLPVKERSPLHQNSKLRKKTGGDVSLSPPPFLPNTSTPFNLPRLTSTTVPSSEVEMLSTSRYLSLLRLRFHRAKSRCSVQVARYKSAQVAQGKSRFLSVLVKPAA
ncbi:MAG: hypothetical protein V7L20_22915 [Nostoc sp.]|uniref:hypothetical protein n=1 Tax=Nostoc sp. TaxID=1180 RepID=UPI002FF8CFF1